MTMTVDSGADAAVTLDAADRLILDEAADLLVGATIVVVGSAELAAAALARGAATVRVSDDLDPSTEELNPLVFAGADVVLIRLTKSLAALDHVSRMIASSAPRVVVVVAGGRLKYMTVGMNEVLRRSFRRLDVSLARQKSRVLIARDPATVSPDAATRVHDNGLDLWIGSVGGVFAASSVDIGTRAMLAAFTALPDYDTAIDFGCGTGILAAQLKRLRPAARVIASDVSAAAVVSARTTAAANELDIEVVRDGGLSTQPDASVDLIVLNPPFHEGGAVSLDTAHGMFAEARRVLRPGGQLWTVWNSHLGYTGALVRTVGPTTQVSRNAKFTVAASTRSSDRLSPNDSATN
jgi:16S rRNA (guanine1207-N2)-methyltransferase